MQKISRCSGYLLLNGAKWDIFFTRNSTATKQTDIQIQNRLLFLATKRPPLSQQDQHLAAKHLYLLSILMLIIAVNDALFSSKQY
jgi:hypothetical protein